VTKRRGNQGKGHGLCILGLNFADEFGAGQHVAPLVVAAHLQGTAVMLKQIQKIIALQEHVVELDKVEALFQADFVAFGSQHFVDAEMPADIAQEFNVVDFGKPVGIIEKQRMALGEIKILGKLFAQALSIVINLFAGENLAHFRLAAGVADHCRTAANKGYGPIAVLLHMGQRHDGHQRTDMEAGGGGIKTDVAGYGAFGEKLSNQGLVGNLFDKTSFL